jgi:hypothetical protein
MLPFSPEPPPPSLSLGVTVMPEWFQCEGIEPVLDRLQAAGADALVTSPYLMAIAAQGTGAREPPPDGNAGTVRPLERPLWGKHETWVKTAPSFVHDLSRYEGLRYQPSPPGDLTLAQPHFMDEVLEAAQQRGIAVYFQVMAASPPGYRVQFSGAVAADQCLGPGGELHNERVDKNASLASPHVHAYGGALLRELAERYPSLHGLRIDWPEYPPYDLRSALFDFSAHGQQSLGEQGVDAQALSSNLVLSLSGWQEAARGAAGAGAAAVRRQLREAGWDDCFTDHGLGAPLWAAKRSAVGKMLQAYRGSLDQASGVRKRLEPQVFPGPFDQWSGTNWDAMGRTSDAVGVKLYTMHWPMIARYWARDLLGASASAPALDVVTEAMAEWMDLLDGTPSPGQSLTYPPPSQAHPVGPLAQRRKIESARQQAGTLPVVAFAHAYGPIDDVMTRLEVAMQASTSPGASGRVWLNRYGYLSGQKLHEVGHVLRRCRAQLATAQQSRPQSR